MDGVLVDAREWHYEALNYALKHFGAEITPYEHETTFDGLPTKEKLNMLSDLGKLPYGLHSIVSKMKQDRTKSLIELNCRPIYDIEYLFSKLKSHGYKIGLCSNSVRSSIVRMMELSSLIKYFDLILSNEDVKKSKPDPEIYIKAMQKLNLSPNSTLIVEDNENGIKAAKSSMAEVLVVKDPYELNWDLVSNKISRINNQ